MGSNARRNAPVSSVGRFWRTPEYFAILKTQIHVACPRKIGVASLSRRDAHLRSVRHFNRAAASLTLTAGRLQTRGALWSGKSNRPFFRYHEQRGRYSAFYTRSRRSCHGTGPSIGRRSISMIFAITNLSLTAVAIADSFR
jgi:hypothetical protein